MSGAQCGMTAHAHIGRIEHETPCKSDIHVPEGLDDVGAGKAQLFEATRVPQIRRNCRIECAAPRAAAAVFADRDPARGLAWRFTALERESQTAASRLCTRPAEELTAQADLAQAAQRRRARIGPDRLPRVAQIGRASCREECRSRWSPYH